MAITEDEYTEYEKRVIEAFRAVREMSGVDQAPLSLAAGMGRNQVNRYEKLHVHATIDALDRLMAAMGDLATRRTTVRTVEDLLANASGTLKLTMLQSGE